MEGALTPISVSPAPDGSHPSTDGAIQAFRGGERLELEVAGNSPIPAFHMSLRAPPAIAVSSALPTTLPRANDLKVDWTYDRSRMSDDDRMYTMVFITVPAGVLQLLPPGDGFVSVQSMAVKEMKTSPSGSLQTGGLMDFTLQNETTGGDASVTFE